MDHPSFKPSAPSVLQHPRSKETTEGKTVTFTVDADGVPFPTFQWYKNGVALEGKTSRELKLDHVGLSDSASYCCSVENENGSVISNTAQLRVQLKGDQTPSMTSCLVTNYNIFRSRTSSCIRRGQSACQYNS